jgi:hypothetical protein
MQAVRGRFDDASRMDRWDSNKLAPGPGPGPGGAEEDSWTPRGRAGRAVGDSWRAEPGTPGGASALGAPRPSLERGGSGWGGREGAGVGGGAPGLSRSAGAPAKDTGGRWAKDE